MVNFTQLQLNTVLLLVEIKLFYLVDSYSRSIVGQCLISLSICIITVALFYKDKGVINWPLEFVNTWFIFNAIIDANLLLHPRCHACCY